MNTLDQPPASSGKALTGKASMTRGTLTEAQVRLLDDIVLREERPAADLDLAPFPDMRTVNALARRGLIKFVPIPRTPGIDAMMAALGCEQIASTPAGRQALAEREGREHDQ